MDGSLGSYATVDEPVESDSSTSSTSYAVTLAASALAIIASLSF